MTVKINEKEIEIILFLYFNKGEYTTSEIAKGISSNSEEWDTNQLRRNDSLIRHHLSNMKEDGMVECEKRKGKKRYDTCNDLYIGKSELTVDTVESEILKIEGGYNIVLNINKERIFMFPISEKEIVEYLDYIDSEVEEVR